MLFLGYDPGGKSTHGVAALEISETGEIVKPPVCAVLQDAKAVLDWIDMHRNVAALGIDTLMAWSPTGSRECDDRLRKKYPKQASSIIPQNSLYSSMTLNGAMVAQHASMLTIPIYESHPKLLMKTLSTSNAASQSIKTWYCNMLRSADGSKRSAKQHDDMADAIVAAWCAAQGHLKLWDVDLFKLPNNNSVPIVPSASYPWFEALAPNKLD